MTKTEPDGSVDRPSQFPFKIDLGRWLIAAIIGVLALLVLDVARNRAVAPFDNVVTEQMCLRHGEELGRSLIGYERSNRFALQNRTDGFCSFGTGPNGEPPVTMTVEEADPGALYTWAKAIGIVLQLGIVSVFIRFVTEPAFDLYRVVSEIVSERLRR